ncbi:MAG: TlyA family RNA methyltransferase [Hominimerdicola sp.]
MSRLDIYITENGFAKSRERAKKLIKDGSVSVDGKVCTKPATEVSQANLIEVSDELSEFVGRGALKLAGAFEEFSLDVSGKVCGDIGASTGGFTQCMLNHGASLVYAVDVGHGQLDKSLCDNPKVINCEGVNARNLTPDFFSQKPEFFSVDLSFISLKLVMGALYECLCDKGEMAVLIKPQFEAGKSALNKKGIVKNPKDHVRVLSELLSFFQQTGFSVCGIVPSSIKGGDGNIEYLAFLKKGCHENDFLLGFDIKKFVAVTFARFDKGD